MTTTANIQPTPSQLSSLEQWVSFGEERLCDTAWRHVDLTDPSGWPSDGEIADGEFYFNRGEVESLLEAQAWLATQRLLLQEVGA